MKPLFWFAAGIGAAILAALLLLVLTPVPGLAGQKCVELGYREGGNVLEHVKQGKKWAAAGECLVIKDWQMSAAAVQVAVFVAHGGSACYIKAGFLSSPNLYFHKAKWRAGFDDSVKTYIAAMDKQGVPTATRERAKRIAATIGPIPKYGWRKVHPSQIGVPQCAKSVEIGRRVGGFRPQVWRMR